MPDYAKQLGELRARITAEHDENQAVIARLDKNYPETWPWQYELHHKKEWECACDILNALERIMPELVRCLGHKVNG